MKTSVNFRTILVVVVMMVAGVISASAKDSEDCFFDKKRNESGQLISKTKYEFVQKGLAQAVYKYEYSYDEMNRLEKEEFYKWNESEKKWQIASCLNHIYSDYDNRVELEYMTWNLNANKFNETSEKAVYWYDNSGNILSYFMSKENINTFDEFTLAN